MSYQDKPGQTPREACHLMPTVYRTRDNIALNDNLQPELHPTPATSHPNTQSPKAASDDRRSHESLWECHTAGSDLGTDGVSGEDTPVLLNSLEPPMGVETNGMDRRGGEVASASEDRAASEPEEGRSPVEEAGREVEGAEDEELGSTVEEGEEAALALGVLSAESDLPWLPIKQASVGHSEEGYQPCEFRDGRFGDEREYADASISMAETLETEVSCTRDCTVTQLGLI